MLLKAMWYNFPLIFAGIKQNIQHTSQILRQTRQLKIARNPAVTQVCEKDPHISQQGELLMLLIMLLFQILATLTAALQEVAILPQVALMVNLVPHLAVIKKLKRRS